jgi:hypothetical protein
LDKTLDKKFLSKKKVRGYFISKKRKKAVGASWVTAVFDLEKTGCIFFSDPSSGRLGVFLCYNI